LLDINDVSDDQVSDGDRHGVSERASVDCHFLIVDFILQVEDLSLFHIVASGRDQSGEEESTVDGEALDEHVSSIFLLLEDRKTQEDSRHPDQKDDQWIFELS
jgi:hypothetical protein